MVRDVSLAALRRLVIAGEKVFMGFAKAVRSVYSNYFTFSGRACRSELWWFELFFWAIVYAFILLSYIVQAVAPRSALGELTAEITVFGFLGFFLGTALPHWAVAIRRMHDLNKSGWWVLMTFFPLVGTLLIIIAFCVKGTIGDNQYGPDPLIRPTR